MPCHRHGPAAESCRRSGSRLDCRARRAERVRGFPRNLEISSRTIGADSRGLDSDTKFVVESHRCRRELVAKRPDATARSLPDGRRSQALHRSRPAVIAFQRIHRTSSSFSRLPGSPAAGTTPSGIEQGPCALQERVVHLPCVRFRSPTRASSAMSYWSCNWRRRNW